MTRIYDATRLNENLTFRDLNEIAILSGVLHVDEEHAHLSKGEILQIRRDVLQTFYTNEQQEEDLKRSQAARDHWATWCESKLRSEADCAMAMVGPILEEVLQIQHEVKFT
ncbi:hypothetical protein BGW39_002993, partial [Mortierella sp. 14UC]